MKKHTLLVFYTVNDDGIHVACEDCEYEEITGINPTVEQLATLQLDHAREGVML